MIMKRFVSQKRRERSSKVIFLGGPLLTLPFPNIQIFVRFEMPALLRLTFRTAFCYRIMNI